MRRLDWFLILLLIIGAVGGEIIGLGDGDGAEEQPSAAIHGNPRRPATQGNLPRVAGQRAVSS